MAKAQVKVSRRESNKRRLEGTKLKRSAILLRLWRYLGRNRTLVILALLLSVSGSLLASYGPKLSGEAINAIDLGMGKVDFDTVFRCCGLMALCYLLSSGLSYLLSLVMLRLSRTVAKQMRHDVFENLAGLPVSFFDQYQTGDLLALQSLESNPQLSFATRMGDWTCLGQHKRQPEFPVVTRESRRNSRKTTWLPRHRKMKPFPATAPQEKSHVRNWRSKGHLAPLMRPTLFPEIPVSLERNTEVFRHPLL